jgi:hypothetical protein
LEIQKILAKSAEEERLHNQELMRKEMGSKATASSPQNITRTANVTRTATVLRDSTVKQSVTTSPVKQSATASPVKQTATVLRDSTVKQTETGRRQVFSTIQQIIANSKPMTAVPERVSASPVRSQQANKRTTSPNARTASPNKRTPTRTVSPNKRTPTRTVSSTTPNAPMRRAKSPEQTTPKNTHVNPMTPNAPMRRAKSPEQTTPKNTHMISSKISDAPKKRAKSPEAERPQMINTRGSSAKGRNFQDFDDDSKPPVNPFNTKEFSTNNVIQTISPPNRGTSLQERLDRASAEGIKQNSFRSNNFNSRADWSNFGTRR